MALFTITYLGKTRYIYARDYGHAAEIWQRCYGDANPPEIRCLTDSVWGIDIFADRPTACEDAGEEEPE